MAKKASQKKKLKKAKPVKKASGNKKKVAKKTTAVRKKVEKAPKSKKVKKTTVKKEPTPKVKQEKPVKIASQKPLKKSKETAPTQSELKQEIDLGLEPMNSGRKKEKKVPKPPKPKKMKQVFTPYNPIQPANASGKPVNTSKKEPDGKFELEYVIRCSEPLLYEFTTSPSGLSEWFADDVNIRDGVYTFIWDGSQQDARLLALKEDLFVRYQWVDKTDGSYFEFRIQTDELTGDVSLIIVDFADNDEEQESSRLLWNTQIDKLMKTIGSHS